MARTGLVRTLIVVGAILLPPAAALSQDAPDGAATAVADTELSADSSAEQPRTDAAAPADDATPPEAATSPAAETAADTTSGGTPPTDADKASGPADESRPGAAPPPADTGATTTPGGTATSGTTADGEAGSGWYVMGIAAVLLALFIVPVLVGNYLAKIWKMPDHAWKFSLVLGTLAASILICMSGEFKFGPDLAGGITLVFELADVPTGADQATPRTDTGQTEAGGREFEMSELIAALKERIDPTGTKEVTIREYGPAIEIIIPETGEDEMEYVKRRITDLGQLEFRITADPMQPKDRPIIEQAKLLPPSQNEVMLGGIKVAEWVTYSEAEFGPVDRADERVVKRLAGDTPEALVLMDPMDVTGGYLSSVTKGIDDQGGPAVLFSFNRQGAQRFRRLTSENKPNPATLDVFRHLGIVLDKRLISAPRIITTISDHGQISGGSMTEQEVEFIVSILKSGSLPAALNKTPISEEFISPTLGAVTIEKGKVAIAASLAAVVLFMLVYYRFAGVVACLALTFNLLLVLALMVLIKAAFTLPGLAGLVLTIGMAVDANVLIYERIREELKSGAALRMAIRNGFGRAMSAIIDSNVTTIITGIVLYSIGTDQVKGFAVTLILGLLTSMFTAIFFARLVFDVAERRGWIANVRMMRFFSNPNYDFLGARRLAGGLSLAVILLGMVAVYFRGARLLDIDFTGGTSVTFTLTEAGKLPIAGVRDALMETELADKNLLVVERGDTDSRYTIDTSVQSVDEVKDVLREKFGDKLMRYSFEISDLKPFTEGEFTGTEAKLVVNSGPGYAEDDGVSHDALRERLDRVLDEAGHPGIQPTLDSPNYRRGSGVRLKEWTIRLTGLDQDATRGVLEKLQKEMRATPLFPLASNIGGRVSSDMQTKALVAIGVSLLSVIAYLWLRFQKASYGVAAAVAVAHDVIVTVGIMALSYYVVNAVPALASALQLESFQISLTIVAALLTIIGYSLNDTIVTFDRLREIKGKSPQLTTQMVNASVNQCLSRTLLTALTVFLVVVILYFFGGDGIHSFAFAFLVGVIAGTYSTVYIAAPVLLWLSGTSTSTAASENRRVVERAG